jgi:predicted DNA-binding transcriptional regulator AlpA
MSLVDSAVRKALKLGLPEEARKPQTSRTLHLQPSRESQLLDISAVAELFGLGESTVRQKVREGTFPKPVKIPGVRVSRWRLSEVEKFLAEASTDSEEAQRSSALKA